MYSPRDAAKVARKAKPHDEMLAGYQFDGVYVFFMRPKCADGGWMNGFVVVDAATNRRILASYIDYSEKCRYSRRLSPEEYE